MKTMLDDIPHQTGILESRACCPFTGRELIVSECLGSVDEYTGLRSGQRELLDVLNEELHESGQAIGKALRHGYEEYSPFDETKTTNRENLERELGHVLAMVSALAIAGDMRMTEIKAHTMAKFVSVSKYLRHNNIGDVTGRESCPKK